MIAFNKHLNLTILRLEICELSYDLTVKSDRMSIRFF